MDSFQVIQPSELLAPYVKQYWFLTMENVELLSQRLVPLGCMALTFHRGVPAYSLFAGEDLPQFYCSGIATHYMDLTLSGNIDFICIVFQPAGAKAFFKVPPGELTDSCISPDTLSDPELYDLGERLQEITNNQRCAEVIEQFLFRRIYRLDRYGDKRLEAVMKLINHSKTDVEQLAGVACLGYKQFKRIFTDHIGVNPKDYLQIIRFQKLHHLLQLHTDMSVVQLAFECGYYDKSHLIKELKAFSGFTPTQLYEACDSVYSGYHALFRSAFIDLSSG